MKQPKWKLWEELLLVDMYFRCVNNNLDYLKECKKLSNILRRAAHTVDDVYRNEEGIRMKYQNIAYLDTGKGLSAHSQRDVYVVNLYKNNYRIFIEELNIVKEMLCLI